MISLRASVWLSSWRELHMLYRILEQQTRNREREQRESTMSGGTKFDDEKPPIDLIDSYAFTETAKVLWHGGRKYGRHNWRKGIALSRLISAAQRHILAFNAGEDLDPEFNLSHLAHAMCCLMFALWMMKFKPQLDDRFKEEPPLDQQ